MRWAGIAIILFLAPPAAGAAATAAAVLPEPIFWRQNVFSIPYRVHRQPGTEGALAEVQLFFSDDAGRSWQLAGRTSPAVPSFTFNATRDGEYWFSLRTIDRHARVVPSGPHRTGLRVIVDTLQPTLDLQAVSNKTGAVVVRWHAVDANLKLESLKIEVRAGPSSTWQPLAIGRPPAGVRGARSGHATWWPQAETGRVTVRAEVFDWAGNHSVTQSEVHLHRPAMPGAATSTISNAASRIPTPSGAPTAVPAPSTPARPTTSQNWPADQVSQAPLGHSQPSRALPPMPTRPVWRPGAYVPQQQVGPQPR